MTPVSPAQFICLMSNLSDPLITVLGVGSSFSGDDAIGLVLARDLKESGPDNNIRYCLYDSIDPLSLCSEIMEIDTDIVVVNGHSLAGNGPPAGEGYFSHTISSPTGEGICTPRDFARIRRICTYNSLRIV